jgi:peptidoglycan-associated lipoprotein
VSFIVFSGCAHKQEAKTEPPPAAPVAAAPAEQAKPIEAAARACTQDTDCKDSEICNQNQCVAITSELAECSVVRVHFPFDSTEINSDDRSGLERSARCLRGHQHIHVTIEGNADERGTEEYNLALGDRRALAVAKYLKTLGASDEQLKTISYGKEKPICHEHDEACWKQNRRAAIRPPALASKEN